MDQNIFALTAPTPTEQVVPDWQHLLIWAPGHSGMNPRYGNNPQENEGNHSYMFQARPADRLRDIILNHMGKCTRGDLFWDAHRLQEELDAKIFGLTAKPSLLLLPRDSLSITTKICAERPAALRMLGDHIIGDFLGNSYSMDWQYMVEIGQGRISTEALRGAFPKATARILDQQFVQGNANQAYLPYAARKALEAGFPILEREQAERVRNTFSGSMTLDDIPTLLSLADHHGAQSGSSDVVIENWDLCADYDGLVYNSVISYANGDYKAQPAETNLHRDFVKANTVFIGTVADLINRGSLPWPEDDTPRAKTAKTYLSNLMTASGREKNARRSAHNAELALIKDNVFGTLRLGNG